MMLRGFWAIVLLAAGTSGVAQAQYLGLSPTEQALLLRLGNGRVSNADFLRIVNALNTVERTQQFQQRQILSQRRAAERALREQDRLRATLNAPRGYQPVVVPNLGPEDRLSSDLLLCWEVLGATFVTASTEVVMKMDKRFDGGMQVAAIRVDGAADRAEWQSGDIIVGLDKWRIRSYDNLGYVCEKDTIAEKNPVRFQLLREGKLIHGDLDILSGIRAPEASEVPAKPLSARSFVVRPSPSAGTNGASADRVWQLIGLRGRAVEFDRPGVDFSRGISVTAVRPESAADKAGIRIGETIVGLGEYQVEDFASAKQVLELLERSTEVSYVALGGSGIRTGLMVIPAEEEVEGAAVEEPASGENADEPAETPLPSEETNQESPGEPIPVAPGP